jgi:hypothetical protein
MYFVVAGIVIGLIFTILWQIYPILSIGYAVFFAICEELVKVVILNYPKFQLKFDTTFYGCTYGLGFGAIVIIAIAYNTKDLFESEKLAVAITLAFSLCFLHCTTGGLIGFGSYKKMMWRYSTPAIIIHIIFNIAVIPTLLWGSVEPFVPISHSIISIFSCTIFTAIVYMCLLKYILPYSLPEDMIRKRRREIRRKRLGIKV